MPKFASPEEELRYLREKVAQKEHQMWQEQVPSKQESVISQTLTDYAKTPASEKLEEHLLIESPEFERVLEHLGSLPHREKMRELYKVLAEKGVLASINLTQSLGNPHIEDDFHRVLVEYVKNGAIVPGLDRERELSKLLHMSLFEVTLPFAGSQEGESTHTFKDVIGAMERFVVGMIPLPGASRANYGHFSLEIALSNFSNDIVFNMAVEDHMKDVFIKQLLGAFPTAKLSEDDGDYNIFNEFGVAVGSFAEVSNNFVYPIQYSETDQDPFTTILNSFTKIERNGEGAAIQFIVYPDDDNVVGKVRYALGQIKQGVPVGRATDIPLRVGGVIAKSFTEFFHTQVKGKPKDEKPDGKALESTEKATAMIEEKLQSSLLRANVRVVASAGTHERALAIRTSVESAFNQFARPQGNGLKFTGVEKGKLDQLLNDFIYRKINDDETLILNTKELATLYHLPMSVSQKDAPQLKTVKAASAPAPSDLPGEGTLLGVNKYRGETREIRMKKADRLRHLYVIGQTGTGKTTLLKNMIYEDIKAGNGVCFIDPHGSDVQDILAAIPKERIDDVIYFDPSYAARPFALNMLEYDENHPEQKIFVVNEMLSIFRKLYSSTPESMGPAFEQYFRNATMLVMEDPATGNTLLEIPRVMADPSFRNLKLSRCKNPIVVQFWRDIATKTSGEAGLQNMIPYITNKFDIFLSNDVMRPIIAQEKSSFDFRDIMDNKKILLVNLSKGKLGDINANLIGLVLVGKILMAALSRVDSIGKSLPDFYLYIDEFQNITTDSISAILSEARKYGLSLNVAHQFTAQLDEGIKKAVFGNVGSMAVFRVGAEDAEFLESQFAPTFKASDIMKIENYNAYLKMLINGKPVPPFNVQTMPPPKGHPEIVEQLKNLSYLRFGKDRKLVDDAIMKKYLSASTANQTQASKPIAPSASQPQPVVPQVATPTQLPPQTPPIAPLVQVIQPVAQTPIAIPTSQSLEPTLPQGQLMHSRPVVMEPTVSTSPVTSNPPSTPFAQALAQAQVATPPIPTVAVPPDQQALTTVDSSIAVAMPALTQPIEETQTIAEPVSAQVPTTLSMPLATNTMARPVDPYHEPI